MLVERYEIDVVTAANETVGDNHGMSPLRGKRYDLGCHPVAEFDRALHGIKHITTNAVLPGQILARGIGAERAVVSQNRRQLVVRTGEPLADVALRPYGNDGRHGRKLELRVILHAPETALARRA